MALTDKTDVERGVPSLVASSLEELLDLVVLGAATLTELTRQEGTVNGTSVHLASVPKIKLKKSQICTKVFKPLKY